MAAPPNRRAVLVGKMFFIWEKGIIEISRLFPFSMLLSFDPDMTTHAGLRMDRDVYCAL
jgi:hypothetical protein